MEAPMDDRSDPRNRPTGGHEPARYDRDLYSWAVEQAALLRAGRIAEADVLNIAEEIDDVGNEQYDKLESALRVILLHLLKWDHQPERRSRSWRLSIAVQRKHVSKVLRKNPGLKPLVDEAATEAYDVARVEAAAQTLLDEDIFPLECPYSIEEIMERPIDWPPAD
jgi:predicted DNA-binding ribbon-helix-helix protein